MLSDVNGSMIRTFANQTQLHVFGPSIATFQPPQPHPMVPEIRLQCRDPSGDLLLYLSLLKHCVVRIRIVYRILQYIFPYVIYDNLSTLA